MRIPCQSLDRSCVSFKLADNRALARVLVQARGLGVIGRPLQAPDQYLVVIAARRQLLLIW